jgi:hypothetical protein
MADEPQTKAGIFDDPSKFGLTPATPPAPGSEQPAQPDMDPARFGLTQVPLPTGIDPITKQPYQYAGNVPKGDPVGEATGQPIQEDRAPGAGVQAAASLATDPEQKRRIVARQLFPDLKPLEAQARVFYGPNGRMAAVGMDGKPYYVDPDRPDFSALRTFSPANLAANVGTMAGPALPAVGGIAGGAAAGPTSLVMGPIAAGVGAAAGDIARQVGANYFDPQPEKTGYNYRQTAAEAGGAAAGQLGGASLLRFFAPNRLALSGTDIAEIRRNPDILNNANTLYNQSAAQGVNLTPGQATNLPSLLSHEDTIASGAIGAGPAELASVRYGMQRDQINRAYQNYLDSQVSPVADKTDAAMQFQQGAEDAQRITRQQANAAARPSYEAAQAGGNVMSPDLAQLADTPAVRSAMDAARTDYQNLYRRPAPDTPDFALWDLTKRKLDDTVNTARRAGENTAAMSADQLRGDLVTHLDAAYPTYATAREAAAPGQRLAARLDSSVGGAEGAGTERARAIVAPVFNSNNPRAISEARDAFTAAGRGDEWNAGVRAYLQDAFDNAAKSESGINPSMLRRQLFGDVNTRNAMQAAMTPEQWQGFNNVMETVEAAARSRGINSATAGRLAGREELTQAASEGAPALIRGVGKMASPDIVKAPLGALADMMTNQRLRGLAGMFFGDPRLGLGPGAGMDFLTQAARLGPGDRRLVSALTEFLGQTQIGENPRVSGRAPTPGMNLPPLLPLAPRNALAPVYGP